MDATSSKWQMQLKSHFSVGTMIFDTILFADDQGYLQNQKMTCRWLHYSLVTQWQLI
jgi:hypothetical protein